MEITVLNKLLKKIVNVCVILTMLIGVSVAEVGADEPVITYGIEYSGNTATITLYSTIIDAFDIAVAYDPSVVTVTDCGYTTQFKELQIGGENTTISVLNDDAKDDAGNTYMVFTGAGANISSGKPIDFAGKPLSFVTFEGNLTGAVVTIVTESAAVSNIYEADKIAELTLSGGSQTVITPEPVDDVVYEFIENSKDSTQGSDTSESTKDETSAQNINNEDNGTSPSTEETVKDETDSVSDGSGTDVKANEDADGDEVIVTEDDDSTENGSISPVFLTILIGIAVILVAVIILVVIRKKKK